MQQLSIYDLPNEIIIYEIFKKWLNLRDLGRCAQTCKWWWECSKVIKTDWDAIFVPRYIIFDDRPTELDLAAFDVLSEPERIDLWSYDWKIYVRDKPPDDEGERKKMLYLKEHEYQLDREIEGLMKKVKMLREERGKVTRKLTRVQKRIRKKNMFVKLQTKSNPLEIQTPPMVMGHPGKFKDPTTGRYIKINGLRCKQLVKAGIIKLV